MNLKTIFTGVCCLGAAMGATAQYNDARPPMAMVYNPNIIAFAPLQFTENGIAGFGVSYEHAIDARSIAAFYLPVGVEFNLTNTRNTANTNKNSDPMFYINPGIKIYPTGGFGPMAKYAIGPSLVIGDGQRTVTDNYYTVSNNYYQVKSHFLIGMMINQSINISPTPWLYIGTEFGIGFTYIDKVGGAEQGMSTLVNFNFKIGVRY
jgi:hypothetical protein